MNTEKIIEIAKFRGINELICKSCGVVSALESVSYEFNGPNVRANCPECGAYIKFMPTTKAWRIFRSAKYGMIEIEKLDNGFLDWYLRTVTKINPDLRLAIEELIARRTADPAAFYVPPLDVETKTEINNIERREFLTQKIDDVRAEMRKRVSELDPNANHGDVLKFEGWLYNADLICENYAKELRRVLKRIKKSEDAAEYAKKKNRDY